MNDYMQKLDKAVDEMFERLSLRFPADDMIRLRQAYTLAKEAHEGQKRAAGDPYIMHPVAVARIVAEEFMLDVNPIVAAFLPSWQTACTICAHSALCSPKNK